MRSPGGERPATPPGRLGRRRSLLAACGAAAVSTTCAVAPEPQPLGAEPDLRIGLVVGGEQVLVGGAGRVVATAGDRAAFRLDGEQVAIRPDGNAVRVGADGARFDVLRLASLEREAHVTVDGRPYRGVVEIFTGGGGVTVVNRVSLETYLAGVVALELGRGDGIGRAALEAQAIVSRTYALKNRGKFQGQGFDLRAGVSDQAYGGVGAETAEARAAVRSTFGQVLRYRGDVITPFFHSTCGGSTASPEEAFRTVRRTPYLRPVSDRRGDGAYCDISPRFRWTVEWDGPGLHDILRRTVPAVLGIEATLIDEIRDLRVHRAGPSGRVTDLRVRVTSGEIPVTGPDLRWVLRQPDGQALGSTAVALTVERRDGRVAAASAQGGGWGHGVGMCQWGAVGRARAGQDARTILTTYFPGTRIDRWY